MRLNPWKWILALALALGAAGAAVGVWLYAAEPAREKKDDKPAADREKIQGTWKVVEVKDDGQDPDAAERMKGAEIVIAADTITVRLDAGERESTYKLDPSASPKAIDIVFKRDDVEEITRAIYKLEGDTLTVCGYKHKKGAEERPTEFAAKEGSGAVLMVLKRQAKK